MMDSYLVEDLDKYSKLIAYHKEVRERKLFVIVRSREYHSLDEVERTLVLYIFDFADMLDVKYGDGWRDKLPASA